MTNDLGSLFGTQTKAYHSILVSVMGVRSYSLCSKTPTADLPHPEHTTLFDDRRYTKKHAEQCKLSGDEYDRTSLQSVAYYVITM